MSPLRLAYGAVLFLFSLLCVFRAPSYDLWISALVVTENGHWLWLFSLLSFLPGWRKDRLAQSGAALSLTAAVLFLTPVFRALPVAQKLPSEISSAFGDAVPRSAPDSPFRPQPLSFKSFITGIRSAAVREDSFVYSRSCGGLALQLYRPAKDSGPSPLVVVVHGGSWRSGHRLELPELSRYLAARGYAVASIDYALAPGTNFPGPVEDVRDALAYLRRNAAELGVSTGPAVLLGRSAGGQIALAAAHADEPIPGVAGVVVFYGPNDLYLAWAEPGEILDSRHLLGLYLGGSPAQFPERYDAASPLLRAGARTPPVLMIHGGRDELVWPVHQMRLSAKLKDAGVPHYHLSLPWATHGCDYFPSGPCGQLSTYAVEKYLAAVLKEERSPRPTRLSLF
jgi:acetyl esterase/lipase